MTAPAKTKTPPGQQPERALAAPPPSLVRSSPLLTASGKPTSPALKHILSDPIVSDNGDKGHRRAKSLRASPSTSSNGVYAGLAAGTTNSLGHTLRRTLTSVKSSGSALKRSLSSSRNRAGPSKGDCGISAFALESSPRHGRSFSESVRRNVTVMNGEAPRRYSTSASSSLSPGISEAPSLSSERTPTMEDESENRAEGVVDVNPSNQEDVKVPQLLQAGVPMYKVSAKKKKMVTFRIDADEGCILWESKKSGIIPIECIKEIRSGADARYYREQFQLSIDYEPRWITIIYIIDGSYKTLHVVATTIDVFVQWDTSLRALYAVRQALMSGLGHGETRQNIWEKRYWKGSDEEKDDKLVFEEVEKMCRRLNLTLSKADLLARFKGADTQSRGYLDFNDFRLFVKSLKARPDISRRYRELAGDGHFTFEVFENFMRTTQKSTKNKDELEAMFKRYALQSKADKGSGRTESTPILPSEPSSSPQPTDTPQANVSDAALVTSAKSEIISASQQAAHDAALVMSLEAFTSFLLSPDNSASSDKDDQIWQDMTRPLPEYFISSSHNTYLVGHQLVGVSTIEGYIRALLHSCRSVEIDVYDGEVEPVIFHGKTFTSKVPLRDICEAVLKYAFVASPYPVIISAEVHCSLTQQDKFASIMHEIFGDILVSAPPEGRPPLDNLPSPEDLRGRILLKAKNLYVTDKEGGVKEKPITLEAESSSSSTSDTSASDSEFMQEIKGGLKHELEKARGVNAVKEIKEEIQKVKRGEPIREIKEELGKARTLYDRVRRRKSPSPARAIASPFATTSGSPPARPAGLVPTSPPVERKAKMSLALVALLVYTVGVKCRGFNKKETYAPEHIFSLSESRANKFLKQSMVDLVKHNRTHLVRIYPNGMRLNSSNYEPHKYWAAGCQLVAINWQTFDLGYMINHSMFQRNGRAGYVLKPQALREPNKELLGKLTNHQLEITIVSAQQLPRRKNKEGREIIDDSVVDPFVEVSVHVPDWSRSPLSQNAFTASNDGAHVKGSSTLSKLEDELSSEVLGTVSPNPPSASSSNITSKPPTARTTVIKNNGFNPIWEESLSVPFSVYGRMLDLVFLRIVIRDERDDEKDEPLAVYCCPVSSLGSGYRHLPLHDGQLSQYLFSTLFVHVNLRDI